MQDRGHIMAQVCLAHLVILYTAVLVVLWIVKKCILGTNVKNKVYKNGYRQRSRTSKTAKKFIVSSDLRCTVSSLQHHHYRVSTEHIVMIQYICLCVVN